MTLLPIIGRGLQAEVRSRRLRKGRLFAALISSVILLVLAISERWISGFNVNRALAVLPIGGLLPFLLLLSGLSRAESLLAVERREGTLPLLLLTHLTGYDIVLAKVLEALVTELTMQIAIIPAAVLPLLAVGLGPQELGLAILGFWNVLFFGLALGILGSVFAPTPGARACLLWPLLPWLAYATPFGFLVPAGPIRTVLVALQPFNPCDALSHVQAAVNGLRPGAFWVSLITSHATAWGLLALAGFVLPRACRWQAGSRADRSALQTWWREVADARNRLPKWRRYLLDRNPFLWLTSRESWPTVQIWMMLILAGIGWGWLAWLSLVGRGLNIVVVLVIAAAVTWMLFLLALIPREASRRLVEDRNSGALELILCTPLDARGIVRGQWLSLSRRYLWPTVVALSISVVLMAVGYATFGFGGMLAPEDRQIWLVSWSAGIFLVPLYLIVLSWVSMSRALFARTPGEASGMALLQTIGVPGFIAWCLYGLGSWAGWDLGWGWVLLLLTAAFVAAPIVWACRARSLLLARLRNAAALRYSAERL